MINMFKDSLGCLVLRIIFYFFKIIRKKKSVIISSYLFGTIGPLTKFNTRAKNNLKYVWPKISNKKIDIICKNMWKNLGKNFGEFIFLHSYNPFHCKNTTIIGFDYAKSLIEENKKRKKGVIFFSAHYGNWELGPYILNKLDLDLMGIYRKSNNTCINRIIQKYRNKDTNYVPKGDLGAKKSYLWLRKGNSLALLMDQKLNEGISVNFLGKPANTATAIAELAIRMDLDIIPIKLSRTKSNGHNITFFKKIASPKEKSSHEEKVRFILLKINDLLSNWITNDPTQWLWIHRRWKKVK